MNKTLKGVRSCNGRWWQMKTIYDACQSANVTVPAEVTRFFQGKAPDGDVSEIDLAPPGAQAHSSVQAIDVPSRTGFRIAMEELPPGIDVLFFYVDTDAAATTPSDGVSPDHRSADQRDWEQLSRGHWKRLAAVLNVGPIGCHFSMDGLIDIVRGVETMRRRWQSGVFREADLERTCELLTCNWRHFTEDERQLRRSTVRIAISEMLAADGST